MKKIYSILLFLLFIFISFSLSQNTYAFGLPFQECAVGETCESDNTGGGGGTSDSIYPVIWTNIDEKILIVDGVQPDWEIYFQATDNIDGVLSINSSDIVFNDVNTSVPGEYSVTAQVTDSSNNTIGETLVVYVVPYLVNTGIETKLYHHEFGYNIPGFSLDYMYEIWIFADNVFMFDPHNDFSIVVLKNSFTQEYYSCANVCTFRDESPNLEYNLNVNIEELSEILMIANRDYTTTDVPEHEFFKYHLYSNTGYIYHDSSVNPFDYDVSGNIEDNEYQLIRNGLFGFESIDGSKVLLTTENEGDQSYFGSFLIVNSQQACQLNVNNCQETFSDGTFTSYYIKTLFDTNIYHYSVLSNKSTSSLHFIDDDLPSNYIFVKKW